MLAESFLTAHIPLHNHLHIILYVLTSREIFTKALVNPQGINFMEKDHIQIKT